MRAMGETMGQNVKRRGSPWTIAKPGGGYYEQTRDPHRNLMRLLERWSGKKRRKGGVGKRYKGRRRGTSLPFPIFKPWEIVHGVHSGPMGIKRHIDDVRNFYSNLKG